MIFVADKGRLCNNILQYGHLYAWGREHGRSTMSMRFAHKYPEFYISHTCYHNTMVYVLAKLAAKLKLIPSVVFDDIHSDYASEQQVMLSHRHVLAKGWCVRFPDLFEKYKSEILQLFAFSPAVQRNVAEKMWGKRGDTLRLGIHVRRGDYDRWCGGRYYYSDEQYVEVIRQFLLLFSGKKTDIYICGNDPELNRDYYSRLLSGEAQVCFPDGSAAEDLCLLSQCDYIIGPPSTFTLVASMYNDALLYWIVDPQNHLQPSSFKTFNYLFRIFDDLYVNS